MDIHFSGYGENAATFLADTSVVKPGLPVKMTGSATVGLCSAGDVFCGVCLHAREGYATVQLSGFVRMPADKNIGTGYKKLSAAAGGKVASAESGREYLVVQADNETVGFIL